MQRPSRCFLLVLGFAIVSSEALAQHDHTGSLPHRIPDFCASPTIQNSSNGAWSSPSTWSSGRIPRAGDRVAIGPGTTVNYDVVSDSSIACVSVQGRLNFATATDTRLTVGTLMVMPDGHLWIGDQSTPVSPSAVAEIVIASQELDDQVDPEQFGTGVLGFGKVTIHGSVRSPAFVRLSAEPRAGTSGLSLTTSPGGWEGGRSRCPT